VTVAIAASLLRPAPARDHEEVVERTAGGGDTRVDLRRGGQAALSSATRLQRFLVRGLVSGAVDG
jgi:hypothetical protein